MPTPIPSSTASTAPTSSSEIITAQQRAREAGLIRNEKEAAYKQVVKAAGTDGVDAKNAKNELFKAQVELESRQSELRALLKGGAPTKATQVAESHPQPASVMKFEKLEAKSRSLFKPDLGSELKKYLKNNSAASEALQTVRSLEMVITEPANKAAFIESLRVYTQDKFLPLPPNYPRKR